MDQDIEQQAALAVKIGQRLKWARQGRGLSLTQLATAVGIDRSMVKYLESGQRAPSVFLLMSLCQTMGISPQYLLWGRLEGVEPKLAAILHSQHGDQLETPWVPVDHANRPNPGKTGQGYSYLT